MLELSQNNCCSEHAAYHWATYVEAIDMLHWDSNKTALWELNHRLLRKGSSRL